ncbi:MAG TPA: fatty acid desaturase [Macromonas sp.]|nr:fatty acid desaturase [Macromonas sp.]
MSVFDSGLNALITFLSEGISGATWWQVLIYALLSTHLTIVSVTLFLHRCQAHRALELHPAVAHVFRFWLWIGTGMLTKEWAAIHRKHHAKCEQDGDPHSPQVFGIKKVFWEGAELYRAEANNKETMERYGHGTPDDWMERNVYTKHSRLGISLMLILNVALFGVLGLAVWAVQMVWIPFWAAGVVNGIGHFWGYRNFEASDASTNVFPWGIIIGGEELHNNHHTYATSAKFSVKPYEFDIGWMYISILQALGLAKAKKTPPKLAFGDVQPANEQTLEAIIANRYEVMAGYARQMRAVARQELDHLKAKQGDAAKLKAAQRWLHRDDDKVPAKYKPKVEQAFAQSPTLAKMHAMREELRQLWSNTSHSREQLAKDLQAWCRRAEDSGIAVLRDYSIKLRAARA